MRNSLILASLLLLPLAANAGTIDDFTLAGGGYTITYSLPATTSVPDFDLFNFFSEAAPTTINGVSGYNVGGSYYDTAFYPSVSINYSFPLGSPLTNLTLDGPTFIDFAFVPAVNPPPYFDEDVVPTFIPGTYTLYQTTQNGSVPYTLTIIPEAAASPTPEPASLILLATGTLGLLGIAAGRRRAIP
jgi:hypothetical protein